MRLTGVGRVSLRKEHTASPSPPMTECSSQVRIRPHSSAAFRTRASSSGFTVAMLMIRAWMPWTASSSPASTASATSRPLAMMAMSVPSRMTSPLPISKRNVSSSWNTGTGERPNRIYTGPWCS